jgi:hypothetical protein
VDEVGVKTSDQIDTSYAPKGDTPVQEVPKNHIEQDVVCRLASGSRKNGVTAGVPGQKF